MEGSSEDGVSDGERSMGGDFSDLWDEDSLEVDSDSQSGGNEGGSDLEEDGMDRESEGGPSSEDQGDWNLWTLCSFSGHTKIYHTHLPCLLKFSSSSCSQPSMCWCIPDKPTTRL